MACDEPTGKEEPFSHRRYSGSSLEGFKEIHLSPCRPPPCHVKLCRAASYDGSEHSDLTDSSGRSSLGDIAHRHFALASEYKGQERYLDAAKELSAALEYHPRDFRLLFNRAYVLDKCRLHHDAIMDYTAALEVDASNAFVYYNRGISYDKVHCFDLAYRDFCTALTILPDHPDLLHNRGYCAFKLNRPEDALRDYSTVLAIDGKHYKARFNRGACLRRLGRNVEAELDFAEAARLRKESLVVCDDVD
jgi:tetratricopeptide (TPR) repeat protein